MSHDSCATSVLRRDAFDTTRVSRRDVCAMSDLRHDSFDIHLVQFSKWLSLAMTLEVTHLKRHASLAVTHVL